jgi:hypothetical protein
MDSSKKRSVTVIFGKTGTGKSYHAKKIIKTFSRVIICDPKHEYDGLVFENFSDLSDYYKEYKPESFAFVCRFENELDYDYVFKLALIIEDLLLVVEEAEIYISPGARSSSFLDLVRYGRHHGISILGIARRATELSIDFKAMCDKIISFKQTFPRDIKTMQELGFEDVENLPEYEFIEIDF